MTVTRDPSGNCTPSSGRDARVGTVDKFQGQEGAVVIFSMATSSPEDAPRNAEFLYSRHRLNVAISRARATAVLICSRTCCGCGAGIRSRCGWPMRFVSYWRWRARADELSAKIGGRAGAHCATCAAFLRS